MLPSEEFYSNTYNEKTDPTTSQDDNDDKREGSSKVEPERSESEFRFRAKNIQTKSAPVTEKSY